uniref:Uncharacterized protein n=1 Tax=Denticeps clupeoides TaxID=299321 RepID=A0AAY4EXV2_9TELE
MLPVLLPIHSHGPCQWPRMWSACILNGLLSFINVLFIYLFIWLVGWLLDAHGAQSPVCEPSVARVHQLFLVSVLRDGDANSHVSCCTWHYNEKILRLLHFCL